MFNNINYSSKVGVICEYAAIKELLILPQQKQVHIRMGFWVNKQMYEAQKEPIESVGLVMPADQYDLKQNEVNNLAKNYIKKHERFKDYQED